jgi:hypothetical protein
MELIKAFYKIVKTTIASPCPRFKLQRFSNNHHFKVKPTLIINAILSKSYSFFQELLQCLTRWKLKVSRAFLTPNFKLRCPSTTTPSRIAVTNSGISQINLLRMTMDAFGRERTTISSNVVRRNCPS